MKATITAAGELIVKPETELEAYALGRWSATNMTDWYMGGAASLPKLMINCEEWPAALEPLAPVPHAGLTCASGVRRS
jgi:hypothetical protein